MGQVIEHHHTPPAVQSNIDHSALIQMAVDKNLDIDRLERLISMKREEEQLISRRNFFKALADFQSKCPNILKSAKGHNSKYATLDSIIQQIRGPLHECGLTYQWSQMQTENSITITCHITHVDGHSECTSRTAKGDYSGKKHDLHAMASTDSYLRRYTLTAILGITTADKDDDGQSYERISQQPQQTYQQQYRPAPVQQPAPQHVQDINGPSWVPAEKFEQNKHAWKQLIQSGAQSIGKINSMLATKGCQFSQEQINWLNS